MLRAKLVMAHPTKNAISIENISEDQAEHGTEKGSNKKAGEAGR
jgi:hypothetical protein